MLAKEIMTAEPACCAPSDSLERAAQVMAERDCGCVPIVAEGDSRRVVGVITDRDIAVRAVARGKRLSTRVGDAMTTTLYTCSPSDDIAEVERAMADYRVRRVLIVDADQHCVGIVAQADIARAAAGSADVSETDLARVVESVSKP